MSRLSLLIVFTMVIQSGYLHSQSVKTEVIDGECKFFTSNSEGFFSDNFFDIISGKTSKIRFTGKALNLDKDILLTTVNEIYN